VHSQAEMAHAAFLFAIHRMIDSHRRMPERNNRTSAQVGANNSPIFVGIVESPALDEFADSRQVVVSCACAFAPVSPRPGTQPRRRRTSGRDAFLGLATVRGFMLVSGVIWLAVLACA
jgi:hypothetical protein